MAADVSFADRFSYIVALTNAFISTGKDADAARDAAKDLEEEILHSVASPEEYKTACDGVLQDLTLPAAASDESEAEEAPQEQVEILNPDGPSYGDYMNATFHADGQMSTIFKAQAVDPAAAVRVVALKITTPSLMIPPHNSEREARLLDQARHENVVNLIETIRDGSRLILVFPFLRQDLENLLRSGRLDQEQRHMIFEGLFKALEHVHSLGLIHRDIKPSNVLLKTMGGPVYLADFGIAWSPTDQDSEPDNAKITDVGTTCYRPPELLFGDRTYGASLDIWAAGCLVAELLRPTHEPLFDAGPLGSELGLIKSMFSTLGTPNDQIWPSAKSYPDWGKMRFQDFPARPWEKLLPNCSVAAIDFLSNTVCYESTTRLTAGQALRHPLKGELSDS